MPRLLKRLLIGLAVLAVLAFAAFQVMKSQTKKHSPEENYTYYDGDFQLSITYCRPYKKGRTIFGGLVPYGEVWRTGANEATVLTATKDFTFGGIPVKAGTYTLWSTPGPEQWAVHLNSGSYGWGVDFDGKAQRIAAKDVAVATVPVQHAEAPLEQFAITVADDGSALLLAWDDVLVAVPLSH
jgi:hypothetical protein